MISKEYIRGFLKTAQQYSAWAGAVRGNTLGPSAQMQQGRRGRLYDPRISDLVGNGKAMRPFAEMLQRGNPDYKHKYDPRLSLIPHAGMIGYGNTEFKRRLQAGNSMFGHRPASVSNFASTGEDRLSSTPFAGSGGYSAGSGACRYLYGSGITGLGRRIGSLFRTGNW